MTVIVFDIEIEEQSLQGVIDGMQPKLQLKEQSFTSIHELIDVLPSLSNAENRLHLAQAINFLARGLEFHVIEEPEEFNSAYEIRINQEIRQPQYGSPLRLTDYGIFDTSLIHLPIVEKGFFVFYVENEYNGLPYKVSISYPLREAQAQIRYELLPYRLG